MYNLSQVFDDFVQISSKDKKFIKIESSLDLIFLRTFPLNNTLEEILLKVSAINQMYNANLFSLLPIAEHILNLDIDRRLEAIDTHLVNELALVAEEGRVKNFYSFATKYCSRQKPDDYSVYDSYVEKSLKYFRDKDNLISFKNSDLKNYSSFSKIIYDFKVIYKLHNRTLKEVDLFLWNYGKRRFPNKY